MHIHKFDKGEGQQRYILFDEAEAIVQLPTRYALALAGRVRYSKPSIPEYLKVLKYFCAYLSLRGFNGAARLDETFATMGPSLVEDWLMQQQSQGKGGATLRFRDAVLKGFMEWLTTQEAGRVRSTWDHPYADGKLKTVAPHRPAPKFLTYQEVSDFIRYGLHDESQRCLAHFMFDTGLRVSEIPRVLRVDLPSLTSLPANVMYFPLRVRGSKGRGGLIKERYTIISRAMLERLFRLHNNWRVYLRARGDYPIEQIPAFLNVLGRPLTAGAVQKQIQKASQRLHQTGQLLKTVTPHCFRHGTALSILKSEHGNEYLENMVVCQRALGHVNIETTEHYSMIPAPLIARMQQLDSEKEFHERYCEAQYIYEHSFKPQREHTERRGHGRRNKTRI